MGRPRKDEADSLPVPSRPPATTPQARENQLINLATDLSEKQLREGTASSAVQIHYLKLATAKENLEREKLKNENLLLTARVNAISSEGDMRVLLEDALNAFRGYQATPDDGEFID
jgi:hypothetical protein